MKAIKVMGTIDGQGQLSLDHLLTLEKNSRIEVIVLVEESEDFAQDSQSKVEILNDFRQAWHEVMTGQTIPASQLWEGIEHD